MSDYYDYFRLYIKLYNIHVTNQILYVLHRIAFLSPFDSILPRWQIVSFQVTTFEALGHRALGWQGQLAVAVVANTFLLGVCSAYAALIGMQLYNLTGCGDLWGSMGLWLPIVVFLCGAVWACRHG